MKFCPVVPEICRGQVHGPRKERRKRRKRKRMIIIIFWKWRPVEIFRCRESIQDVEIEQCWICAVLWWPLWKWRPVEMFRCQESIRDIIIYPHMKCRWNRTMLNLCGIVVAILKMATGRNFSMSGINSGHHYLPTYQILMISDNVEFLPPIF